MSTGESYAGGNPAMDKNPIQGWGGGGGGRSSTSDQLFVPTQDDQRVI